MIARRPRSRANSPELQSAARAKRARDHLERKRERERVRLDRERRRNATLRGRERALQVLTPILFVAALSLGVVLAKPLLERTWLAHTPIERVAVQGTEALSPEAIAAGVGAFAGQSLAAIDPAQVERVVEDEPWIASARALRLPTGTLVVQVVERKVIARWQVEDEDAEELVDDAGSRFAGDLAPAGSIPLVRGTASEPEALPAEALQILGELARHTALSGTAEQLVLHLPGHPAETPNRAGAQAENATSEAIADLSELAETDRNIASDTGTDTGAPSANEASPDLERDADAIALAERSEALDLRTEEALRAASTGYVLELGETGPRALLGSRLFPQRVARLAALLDDDEATVQRAQLIDLRYADRAVLQTGKSTSG